MKLLPAVAELAVAALVAWTIPVSWCGRQADEWFDGEASTQKALARSVIARVEEGLTIDDFHTGSDLYDGEWLFGTLLMSGIGLCQLVHAQPAMKDQCEQAIEKCIEGILSRPVREFDSRSWGDDAIETLEGGRGHAAYLGYLNFLLCLYREIAPDNRFSDLNDRISAALFSRISHSTNGLVETYPGEWYPVDNSPVVASLLLHSGEAGESATEEIRRRYKEHCVDPATGLLIQALSTSGTPADRPRGSGTALAVFFLGHAWPDLASELFNAMRAKLATSVLGFGAMREYPHSEEGRGDIDSGPIILGLGYSATGFAIGGARICGDREIFHGLFASAYLAGAPVTKDGRLEFVTGGPLGNAIMLAMLTAPPAEGF